MDGVDVPIQIAIGLGVAVFVIRQFVDLWPRIVAAAKNGHGTETIAKAGEQSREFWQLEHRRAVAEVIGPMMAELVGVGKEQTAALRELTQEIRDDRAVERGRRESKRGR